MFTRPAFWCFLLVVMVGLSALQKTAMRNIFLFAASMFFYWSTSTWFVLLLLFSTVIDWLIGLIMNESKGIKRKSLLLMSIFINLGLLGFSSMLISLPTLAQDFLEQLGKLSFQGLVGLMKTLGHRLGLIKYFFQLELVFTHSKLSATALTYIKRR